jgi:hypothetical protein
MSRDERAIRLRDAALALVQRSSKWRHYAGYSMLTYRSSNERGSSDCPRKGRRK